MMQQGQQSAYVKLNSYAAGCPVKGLMVYLLQIIWQGKKSGSSGAREIKCYSPVTVGAEMSLLPPVTFFDEYAKQPVARWTRPVF